ncbi:putative ATP-dependent Clp protease ATP-binding subunit [Pantoea phage vB_PagM_AAM22]|nr:putative ATP-dependent Clp protease ATP-binding subunit [Pantoea phage vB_PagM_AAM22]
MSVKCSFCGIDNNDASCPLIVSGPDNVAICNDCVMKCVTIMNDKLNDYWAEKNHKESDK